MTGTRPVLIVDDDDDIRETLVEVLEDCGHPAIAAANGREALDLLRSSRPLPSVILLDLMMPVMDGKEFRAEQLRDEELARIPVILISAYRDAAADARAMSVAEYLRKPPMLQQLLRAVEQHSAA